MMKTLAFLHLPQHIFMLSVFPFSVELLVAGHESPLQNPPQEIRCSSLRNDESDPLNAKYIKFYKNWLPLFAQLRDGVNTLRVRVFFRSDKPDVPFLPMDWIPPAAFF